MTSPYGYDDEERLALHRVVLERTRAYSCHLGRIQGAPHVMVHVRNQSRLPFLAAKHMSLKRPPYSRAVTANLEPRGSWRG